MQKESKSNLKYNTGNSLAIQHLDSVISLPRAWVGTKILQARWHGQNRTDLSMPRGRKGVGGKDWELGNAKIIIYRMDKQQGPTVQHRDLYSIH